MSERQPTGDPDSAGLALADGRTLTRDKTKQVLFFGVLLAVTLLLLVKAWQLPFMIRGTIGPGFYPAMVLIALGLAVLVALVELVRRREIVLMSPFSEGLRNDTILRGLAEDASDPLGYGVRIVPRNGAGVFSALHTGLRATDGGTVTVASSDTPDLTPAQTAAWVSSRFRPVAGLLFDPDVLVTQPGGTLNRLAASGAAPRIGFIHTDAVAAPIVEWLTRRIGRAPEVEWQVEAGVVPARLAAGTLSAAVLPASEVRGAVEDRTIAAVVVFGPDDEETRRIGMPAVADGAPLISGAWAGLALPPAAAGIGPRLHRAFADALARRRRRDRSEEDDRAWRVTEPGAFADLLSAIAAGGNATAVQLPRGRLTGLLATIAATLGFFWIMEALGFPLAAFLFLAGLMLLLEPRLDRSVLIRIGLVSAGLSIALHQLFWRVFYVVFPDGFLFGG